MNHRSNRCKGELISYFFSDVSFHRKIKILRHASDQLIKLLKRNDLTSPVKLSEMMNHKAICPLKWLIVCMTTIIIINEESHRNSIIILIKLISRVFIDR